MFQLNYNTISPYNKIKNLQSSTSLESQAEFLLDIPILLFKYIYQNNFFPFILIYFINFKYNFFFFHAKSTFLFLILTTLFFLSLLFYSTYFTIFIPSREILFLFIKFEKKEISN